MKRGILILLVVVGCIGGAASAHAIGWSLVNAKIRHDFPEVKRITTAELAAWMDDGKRPQPTLLDVRTRAEFEVSHLPRARHITPDSAASVIREAKDQPIVTYCSVGYRSGGFAKKLMEAGYTNVVNLEGSIFRWANEGRPIVRDGRNVEQVHPYNRTWGMLLKKQLRASL